MAVATPTMLPDYGILGSSDLDQASPLAARLQTDFLLPLIYPVVRDGKFKAKFLQKRLDKRARESGDYVKAFLKMFGKARPYVTMQSCKNQFYSDLITPLPDKIHVPGTEIHIFYALKMGAKYRARYQQHFAHPVLHEQNLQHEELLACHPEQLIPRLYDAETGTVKVGGVDVRDYNLDVLRREVSMVLQKNVLFSGTILDNLRWGDENASEEECIRVAKLACADEFIERFPDKYNTWIEQGGSNVSGGQKQRLTIARALLRKPKVLILDDSTSAVDTATDAKIRKAFREEIPGTTKIIIAQRISSVQDADRILVLENGQINGLGTHAELLATNAIYQEVYNSQTQGGGDFDKQGGAQ